MPQRSTAPDTSSNPGILQNTTQFPLASAERAIRTPRTNYLSFGRRKLELWPSVINTVRSANEKAYSTRGRANTTTFQVDEFVTEWGISSRSGGTRLRATLGKRSRCPPPF